MNINELSDKQPQETPGEIMVSDRANLSIGFTRTALEAKATVLAHSATVVAVDDAGSQQKAVFAQKELGQLLGQVEKARKRCKEPVLEFGRLVDSKAKAFIAELEAEELRVSRLIADFQALELARVRAAEQAQNQRLTALEQEKAKELCKVKTHEEFDEVQQRYNDRALAESTPLPAPIRAKGQRVREEWEITVTDIWALVRAHPACVKVEPRLSEIKQLLESGVTKVPGVSAKRVVLAGVTTAKLVPAIDV